MWFVANWSSSPAGSKYQVKIKGSTSAKKKNHRVVEKRAMNSTWVNAITWNEAINHFDVWRNEQDESVEHVLITTEMTPAQRRHEEHRKKRVRSITLINTMQNLIDKVVGRTRDWKSCWKNLSWTSRRIKSVPRTTHRASWCAACKYYHLPICCGNGNNTFFCVGLSSW